MRILYKYLVNRRIVFLQLENFSQLYLFAGVRMMLHLGLSVGAISFASSRDIIIAPMAVRF